MTGVYKLVTRQVSDAGTGTGNPVARQKIYTADGYLMYADCCSGDSMSSWGVGRYTIEGDSVIENMIISAGDTSSFTDTKSVLEITKTGKGYKQVIPEMTANDGSKFRLVEEYEKTGDTARSLLDGLWKLVDSYMIHGKDSTNEMKTYAGAFQAFQSGRFSLGYFFLDSTGRHGTRVAFGSFHTNGNKLIEKISSASSHFMNGNERNLKFEWKGPDEFTQVSTEADSFMMYEKYQRLGK
jgi:hypothetical protein